MDWINPKLERLEFLCDGVFATAMVLLALDLKIPRIPANRLPEALWPALVELWPRFASFGLSILVIGMIWTAHRFQTHFIRRTDRLYGWLTLLYLGSVALIPFAAGLLGQYWEQPLAARFYAAVLMVGTTLNLLICLYATRGRRLVDADCDPGIVAVMTRRAAENVVIYSVAFLLSLISAKLCLAIFVLAPVFFIIPGRMDQYWPLVLPRQVDRLSDHEPTEPPPD